MANLEEKVQKLQAHRALSNHTLTTLTEHILLQSSLSFIQPYDGKKGTLKDSL